MIKKIYFVLLFMCINTHFITAMENACTRFKKHIQHDFLKCYFAIRHPSVQMIGCIPQEREHFVCHDYALSTVLNLTDNIAISQLKKYCKDDKNDIFKNYFKKTSDPQPGDIIMYKHTTQDIDITHTGIVYDHNFLIMSKWGEDPFILLHEIGDVPREWGDHVSYYRLTASTKNISQLKRDIQQEYQRISKLIKLPSHRQVDFQLIRICILTTMIIGLYFYT